MEKNRSFKFVVVLDLVSIDAVINDAESIRSLYSELGLLETRAPITKAVAKVAQIRREKAGIDARGLKDGM